jgi:hypothetical protein
MPEGADKQNAFNRALADFDEALPIIPRGVDAVAPTQQIASPRRYPTAPPEIDNTDIDKDLLATVQEISSLGR